VDHDSGGEGVHVSPGRDRCCPAGIPTLVFARSGSSKVGQLTNGLALRLARDGHGLMPCLAGTHLGGFVVPATARSRPSRWVG
jgi:uncharacterized metal-binding protein